MNELEVQVKESMLRDAASRNHIEMALLEYKVVELRRSGWTYSRISQELGVGVAQVGLIVKNALLEIRKVTEESVEQLRQMELERLDEIQRALWPGVESGNLKSIDRMLKLMERRSKLLGLDAPTRLAGHDGSALTIGHFLTSPPSNEEEIDRELRFALGENL